MIVVNTETIPGYRILSIKGLVQGNTVRAKHVGRDIAASLKNLVGGELTGYTELLVESRRESLAQDAGTGPATGCQCGGQCAVCHQFHYVGSGGIVLLRHGGRRRCCLARTTADFTPDWTWNMIQFQLLMQIVIPLMFVLVGLLIGKGIEMHHFKRLAQREQQLSGILVTNLKTIPPQYENAQPILVMGSAVIATDYFKVFAAGLRTLFGGEIKSYVTLMERARREAVVRMLEQAAGQGATAVWNIRYETSTTQGQQRKRPGGVEILVYGTALK